MTPYNRYLYFLDVLDSVETLEQLEAAQGWLDRINLGSDWTGSLQYNYLAQQEINMTHCLFYKENVNGPTIPSETN